MNEDIGPKPLQKGIWCKSQLGTLELETNSLQEDCQPRYIVFASPENPARSGTHLSNETLRGVHPKSMESLEPCHHNYRTLFGLK